jgi:hypothetical protein
MVERKMVERRRRGLPGRIMLAIFWLANAGMAAFCTLLAYVIHDYTGTAAAKADAASATIASGLWVAATLLGWLCVAAITGILAYATRGDKEIIECGGRPTA